MSSTSEHREAALEEADRADGYFAEVGLMMKLDALMHAVLYVGDQLRQANELRMIEMTKEEDR